MDLHFWSFHLVQMLKKLLGDCRKETLFLELINLQWFPLQTPLLTWMKKLWRRYFSASHFLAFVKGCFVEPANRGSSILLKHLGIGLFVNIILASNLNSGSFFLVDCNFGVTL